MLIIFKPMLCVIIVNKTLKYQLPNRKPFAKPNSKEINYMSNFQSQNNPYLNIFRQYLF
jgi:hypothetical protein